MPEIGTSGPDFRRPAILPLVGFVDTNGQNGVSSSKGPENLTS